ncbi:MAG: hypothetical protein ACLR56_12960 [Oscillospiraceae bacterium]
MLPICAVSAYCAAVIWYPRFEPDKSPKKHYRDIRPIEHSTNPKLSVSAFYHFWMFETPMPSQYKPHGHRPVVTPPESRRYLKIRDR